MEKRLQCNVPALSQEELKRIQEKRVLVCGCGGLGGWIVEMLVRLGVGHITAVDGDLFEESDLNRQLLADRTTLGRNKAAVARERARNICPDISFVAAENFMTAENAEDLCAGHDLVMDALDTAAARLMLSDACTRLNIPLIHGAIEGWQVQAALVLPGSGLLHAIYGKGEEDSAVHSSLSFAAAYCASVQVSEAALLLSGRKPTLEGKVLICDLSNGEMEKIVFDTRTNW